METAERRLLKLALSPNEVESVASDGTADSAPHDMAGAASSRSGDE